MPKYPLNPFITSGPVPVDRFINRDREIYEILSHIINGQNTAVVGGPKIGKSSLLQFLAGSESCSEQLGAQFTQTAIAFLDCHLGPGDCTPNNFWQEMLACIWANCNDILIRRILKRLETNGLRNRDLDQLFRTATRRDWRIVLLVDGVDTMLRHPDFNNASFLGPLSSLLGRFRGFSLVTSSRTSVAEMNRLSQKLNKQGSRFFDGFIEIDLGPFEKPAAKTLLDTTLARTGVMFNQHDRDVIRSLAGGHPFLLQAAASAVYDAAIVAQDDGKSRYIVAIEIFYRATQAYFDELWQYLSSQDRLILTILCLGEMQGRTTNSTYRIAGIARRDHTDSTLSSLSERGIIESIDQDGLHPSWRKWVVWEEQYWRVVSRGLVWWVVEQVVLRNAVDWPAWRNDKQGRSALNKDEMNTLKEWSLKISKNAINAAVKIGELLLQE